MATEVGNGQVAIFPTFKGFRRGVQKEIEGAERDGSRAFSKGFAKSSAQAGTTAGKGFRQGFQGATSGMAKQMQADVAKAAKDVSTARLREQDAVGKVRVAEAQLAEARKKYADDSSQVIRAEERLNTAVRNLGVRQDATRTATDKLKAAQADLARVTERAARGMGFKRAARDMYGLLAPVRLVGRTLAGPLVRSVKQFTDGWSNVSRVGGTALQRLGQNTRVLVARVAGAAGTVGATLSRPFTAAWSGIQRGASAAARGVQRALGPTFSRAGQWLAPMTRAFQTSFQSAGRLMRGLAPVASTAVSGISSAFSAGFSSIGRLAQSTMQSVSTVISGAATAAAGALTGALVGGWGRMTSIENAQAQLTGLGHSTEAVASIMDSALSSVEGTAFGLGDAATVAASAVAAGIKPGEELTKYLSTTAAAAAAANVPLTEMGGILNRVQTNGKAYTQELNQLSDRGLPIWQTLADQMGVSQDALRDMVSSGEVDAAAFTQAVQTMSGDVAQAMGNTVTGTFANMRTAFSRLGATLLTPFQETFKELFTTVGAGVSALTTAVAPVVQSLADNINGWLLPALQGLQDVFSNGFSIDGGGLVGTLGLLAPIIGAIVGGLGPLLSRLPMIGGLFAGLTGPVGLLVGGLITLGTVDLSQFEGAISGVIGQLPGLITSDVGTIADVVPKLITTIVSNLVTNLPVLLDAGLQIVTALLDGIVQALPVLLSALVGLIPTLVDAIATLLPQLVALIVQMVPQIVTALITALPLLIQGALQLFTGLLSALVQVIPMLITSLIKLVPTLSTALIALLPQLLIGAQQLFVGLLLGLIGVIPDIVTALVEMIPQLVTTLISMIPVLISGALDLFLGLVTGLVQAIPKLIAALIGALPEIIAALIGLLPQLVVAAIELFVGLAKGLVEAIPQIIDSITNDLGPALIEGVLALGPALLDAGKELIGKVGQGISDGVGAIGDAIGGAMDWVGGFFPHSPAKRGPFSGRGWTGLASSGEALFEQFAAGIDQTRDIRMPGIQPGITVAPGSSSTAGATFNQYNDFAHEDPQVGIELTGQKLASVARRGGL